MWHSSHCRRDGLRSPKNSKKTFWLQTGLGAGFALMPQIRLPEIFEKLCPPGPDGEGGVLPLTPALDA
jgi:hypothetical protein